MAEKFDPIILGIGPSGKVGAKRLPKAGMNVALLNREMSSALARPVTCEKEPRGNLGLVVDRDESVLLDARAVAPHAGEWIH